MLDVLSRGVRCQEAQLQRGVQARCAWAQVASQLHAALGGPPDIVIDCAGFESTLQVQACVAHKPALCLQPV